ncbi:hypothetical protein [Rickettsia endosymbiont of Urophora cardui]|uniref:hypothetical protein n=1 Tax=Rickettsia endosymbiont of Urophora cardui TaxID=3066265 RepID=UPI00313D0233
MQIEKNKKINEAIDLLIEGGVDLKTVLSQNGLIKENDAPRSRATRYLKKF